MRSKYGILKRFWYCNLVFAWELIQKDKPVDHSCISYIVSCTSSDLPVIQDVIPGIAFFLNLPLSHNIQVIEMQVLYCINSILL